MNAIEAVVESSRLPSCPFLCRLRGHAGWVPGLCRTDDRFQVGREPSGRCPSKIIRYRLEQLRHDPSEVAWLIHLMVLRHEHIVVRDFGFHARPDKNGMVDRTAVDEDQPGSQKNQVSNG